MKYLKSYKTKEEYINAIKGGGNTHSLPNVALIKDDDKKPYYDVVRMSDNQFKDIWDRIKEKGWNYNTTSAITTQELALITSDEFNSLNEVEPTNMPGKAWKGLKTFDEFKYFTGVESINATKKSSSGNRVGGFNAAKELESITLPSSLKEIGDFAFNMNGHIGSTYYQDTKLKYIYGGENVEKIGYSAFQCCSALTEFNLSDKLTDIGSLAFRNCTSLTSVTISNSVTSIGTEAFNECWNLEIVNGSNSFIRSTTTDITRLFYRCYKLKELDLSNCDFSGIINYGASYGANSGLDYFVANCSSLAALKLGKFNISGFTNGTNYNLFTNDTSLKDIYITSDSPSLSFLESQCVLSKIASNVTIHFGEELYTYNGSTWVKK